jgi:hypothetical protein
MGNPIQVIVSNVEPSGAHAGTLLGVLRFVQCADCKFAAGEGAPFVTVQGAHLFWLLPLVVAGFVVSAGRPYESSLMQAHFRQNCHCVVPELFHSAGLRRCCHAPRALDDGRRGFRDGCNISWRGPVADDR